MSYFKQRWRNQEIRANSPHAAFPENCLIEVTNACNHACVFCHNPFMHRKTGVLDIGIFERFLREAHALGLREVGLYSTGEPFMAKRIEAYVGIARDVGLSHIYITTNGALATLDRVQTMVANGLNSIKFSINAASRESYRLTHGRDDFDKVVANVRAIHAWKTEAGIPLRMLGSFIYTDLTEGEIETHRALFAPYFEDTIYMRAQSQGGRTGPNIEGIVPAFAAPDPKSVGPCMMLWNRLHLTCEGLLSACCVDYEHDLTYADYASGAPLAELWNNAVIQALRRRHLDRDFEGTICKNCLLGGRNPYQPISNLRGTFSEKGRFDDETRHRIDETAELLKHRAK